MPLIIVSGLPTSGKTHRAKQLQAHLAARIAAAAAAASSSSSTLTEGAAGSHNTGGGKQPPYRLHYISDSALSISRDVYDLDPEKVRAHTRSANASEKDARAAVYGAVKRVLSDRDIVILDGLNYIKGWRYQLHCEAKAVRTPSVVLQIGCGVERARGINEERLRRRRRRRGEGEDAPTATRTTKTTMPAVTTTTTATETAEGAAASDRTTTDAGGEEEEEEEEPYEPDNWENLVFRYEEPNPMTRWDSPLFTLIWDDDDAQAARVFDDVWDAVAGTGRKAVKPNQATVQRSRDASGDYLYVLDRETQDVVRRVLEAQGQGGEEGGEVTVPRGAAGAGAGMGTGEGLVVRLPGRKVGLPQLQRLRRAFVGLNRGGIGLEGVGSFSVERMRESFVGYLNDSFDQEG
ncbi:RNA polymerase II elongator complex subunit [Colletotrichum sublineola]|nr:RNA polymerase II elongator complex subunit [Colletotrichum sublineola]